MQFEIAQTKVKELGQKQYRIKITEKVTWVIMAIFSFFIYRNPMMGQFVFVEYGMYSASAVMTVVGSLRYLAYYFEKHLKDWEEKNKKLNSQIQDIKMQLLT